MKFAKRPQTCCCNFGAAVHGEYPEFGCAKCPVHQAALGETELCRRHQKEKQEMSEGQLFSVPTWGLRVKYAHSQMAPDTFIGILPDLDTLDVTGSLQVGGTTSEYTATWKGEFPLTMYDRFADPIFNILDAVTDFVYVVSGSFRMIHDGSPDTLD